jgi:hypothetical protein
MGIYLLWTGLTLIQCSSILHGIPQVQVVGAVIMVIGCILMWLGK